MFPIINLGPLSIPTPAFLLILGYIAGSYLLEKKSSLFSMASEIIDRALWIGTISALIGARLSYIAGAPSAFRGNILSILSLNPALLDPVGGLLIGGAAVFLVISKQKTDYWLFLDSITFFLGAMLPAFFLSRFSAGNGFGIPTDLPWGVFLWGVERHPVQIYLTIAALILLIIIIATAPIKELPPGSTFLIFIAATFSYLVFLTAYQEPSNILISGFRSGQIILWLLLLFALILLNFRFKTSITKVDHEIEK